MEPAEVNTNRFAQLSGGPVALAGIEDTDLKVAGFGKCRPPRAREAAGLGLVRVVLAEHFVSLAHLNPACNRSHRDAVPGMTGRPITAGWRWAVAGDLCTDTARPI